LIKTGTKFLDAGPGKGWRPEAVNLTLDMAQLLWIRPSVTMSLGTTTFFQLENLLLFLLNLFELYQLKYINTRERWIALSEATFLVLKQQADFISTSCSGYNFRVL
jgi:hypothetical protein